MPEIAICFWARQKVKKVVRVKDWTFFIQSEPAEEGEGRMCGPQFLEAEK